MSDLRCQFCEEPIKTRCRRCELPLCAFHVPMSPDLACATCEEQWNAGSSRRTVALLPVFLIGLAVGLLPVWAVVNWISAHGGGPVLAVFAVVMPVAIGGVLANKVGKRTFRRKFLAERPGAISRR